MRPISEAVVLDGIRNLFSFTMNKSLLYELVSNYITTKLLDLPSLPSHRNYFDIDVCKQGCVSIIEISDALVTTGIQIESKELVHLATGLGLNNTTDMLKYR